MSTQQRSDWVISSKTALLHLAGVFGFSSSSRNSHIESQPMLKIIHRASNIWLTEIWTNHYKVKLFAVCLLGGNKYKTAEFY